MCVRGEPEGTENSPRYLLKSINWNPFCGCSSKTYRHLYTFSFFPCLEDVMSWVSWSCGHAGDLPWCCISIYWGSFSWWDFQRYVSTGKNGSVEKRQPVNGIFLPLLFTSKQSWHREGHTQWSLVQNESRMTVKTILKGLTSYSCPFRLLDWNPEPFPNAFWCLHS